VHRAEVGLALGQPERDPAVVPASGGRHQARLGGGDRPRHLPPLPDPGEPGSAEPPRLPLVPGEGAGVDLLHVEAAGGADLAGLAHRPLDQQVGAGSTGLLGQSPLDDVQEEHPAAGPVVDAAPGPRHARVVADHDVLAGPEP